MRKDEQKQGEGNRAGRQGAAFLFSFLALFVNSGLRAWEARPDLSREKTEFSGWRR